jgi:cytochrome c-type biogenesis protein CcmH
MRMEKRKTILVLVILSSLSLAFSTASYARDPVADITKELICSCGCGKVAYDCYCDTAAQWKEQILRDVTAGKTQKQIIASFVDTYGDGVLATPKKSGLELSIWTLPVIAAVFGTAVIYTYAKRKAPIPDSEVDSKILEPGYSGKKKKKKTKVSNSVKRYDDMLQKELKKRKKKR